MSTGGVHSMKSSKNYMRNMEMSSELLPTKCECTFGHGFALTDFASHICTEEALRTIYGTGSACEKSDWFKVFQGNRQFDLVSERDRQKHAEQRRLVAQIYSATGLRSQEDYIDTTLKQLCRRFDSKLDQPFDISDWIQYWSFGKCRRDSRRPPLS